jgi:hydrogenase expression/formation protein HypC
MCISQPARVIEVDADRSEAVVEIDGARKHVSLAVMTLEGEPVASGDWVLVNTGLALGRIEPSEAARYETWFSDATREPVGGER